MKLALLATLALGVPGLAIAQPARTNLTPAQTLAKVEATYAAAKEIAGEFTQIQLNATFGTTELSRGTFEIARPDKIRFDYFNKKNKPSKSFVFDGTTLWYEEPLNRRVTKTAASTSALPSAIAFLATPGQTAKEFTIAPPANKNHLVPGSIVYAPSGDAMTYELTKVNLVAKLAPERFAYVVPKGYELKTAPQPKPSVPPKP